MEQRHERLAGQRARGLSKAKKRRVYKIWEEGRAPQFVLEVTSKKTRLEDEGNKKGLYLRLGVEEYVLFDPDGDYLDPPLRGFRRQGEEYRPIRPGPGGVVEIGTLGSWSALLTKHHSANGRFHAVAIVLADATRSLATR